MFVCACVVYVVCGMCMWIHVCAILTNVLLSIFYVIGS